MPVLAFSALDALLGVGLAAAGFLLVALVCAAVLAVLQLVLPSTDSGAAELDRLSAPVEQADEPQAATEVDSEANA
ncbi:MAG TPA: hypothetical protein VLO10_02675 [Candidatus Deferrimicrobium sp.]|nr:hypothetical protein [Candidatus Deferrimicrobium sp.]